MTATNQDPAPFATSMAWLLDNPWARFRARGMVRRLPLRPGMRVVDIGCGPGRLTLPVARAVGEDGEVLAVDVQPAMLRRLEGHARRDRLRNVRTLAAAAGSGALPRDRFDLALLVAVLGEIPTDRRRPALQEIARALRPGGLLVVFEGLIDPHRQRRDAILGMATAAGLELAGEERRIASIQLFLRRPADASTLRSPEA
ncbi:MAG: methyltransferase domain-containing protein [Candidatus Dormiibacterota bacterium]